MTEESDGIVDVDYEGETFTTADGSVCAFDQATRPMLLALLRRQHQGVLAVINAAVLRDERSTTANGEPHPTDEPVEPQS